MSDTYQDDCPNWACSGTITRDTDTGDQVGRCLDCGAHEKDGDFNCNPYEELDFND